MSASRKVVLITNAYAPYRVPGWESLARMVDQLDIILLTEREDHRLWNMKHSQDYALHILHTRRVHVPWLNANFYSGGRIISTIEELNPTHIILTGFHHLQFLEVIVFARFHQIPLVQWYESHARSSRFSRGVIRAARKAVLRQADAWIAPGQMTRDYFESMGIPAGRIVNAPSVVDTAIFGQEKIAKRSGRARFLYVGRFIPAKGLGILMDAFPKLPAESAMLRLVGYGDLEDQLRELAEPLENVDVCPPTTSPEETARHYAWADVLVFPTFNDTWGLVVNEALATGCYVISSAYAGVTPDLVLQAPLEAGRMVDPYEGVDRLFEAMKETVDSIDRIRAQRQAIRQWGLRFTPEKWAEAVLRALRISSQKAG